MKRIIWISLFVIFFFSVANLALSKEDNFRFSLNFRDDLFSLSAFRPSWYTLINRRSLESYRFPEIGESLPLLETADIAFDENNRRFDLGFEFRPFRGGWLRHAWIGVNYSQTGKIRLTNHQKLDAAKFGAILGYDPKTNSYFYHETWVSRTLMEQETNTSLYGRNLRLAFKYRLYLGSTRESTKKIAERICFFYALGADIWQVNHKVTQEVNLYSVDIDTGMRNGLLEKTQTEEVKRKYLLRGFFEGGAEVLVFRNVRLGATLSFYDRGLEVEFKNDLLFAPGDFWKTDIERASFKMFLILSY